MTVIPNEIRINTLRFVQSHGLDGKEQDAAAAFCESVLAVAEKILQRSIERAASSARELSTRIVDINAEFLSTRSKIIECWGKTQGIDFKIDELKKQQDTSCFFIILLCIFLVPYGIYRLVQHVKAPGRLLDLRRDRELLDTQMSKLKETEKTLCIEQLELLVKVRKQKTLRLDPTERVFMDMRPLIAVACALRYLNEYNDSFKDVFFAVQGHPNTCVDAKLTNELERRFLNSTEFWFPQSI